MTTDRAAVEAYLAAQPASARKVLARVRATIRSAVRGATESITYRIPTYKVDGEMVCFFAGHREHYALYPVTARALQELGAELKAAMHGKGTIRFAYDKPIPTRLITRFVKVRAAEAAERTQARAAKKSAKKKAVKATRAPAKKKATKKAAKAPRVPAEKQRAASR
jgi:uncharacterized protein YdhG (YjbR/CyaY superfamily)